ncbi:MAG: deoxynucleoside kinase, partial [Clostridia bacterium]|nr:deoxynucleoside kinase [Deltaproteobacteria bacterium]
PPDLMIYLKASLPTIRKRIRLRGRPEEQTIAPSYLRDLNGLYNEWIAVYERSPVIVIETDKLDYLSDLVHRIDVLKTIEKYVN